MSATTEYRPEQCPDCGADRERVWLVKTAVAKGVTVPRGWRVEHRSASWKTIAAPTRDTTLCLCDAP